MNHRVPPLSAFPNRSGNAISHALQFVGFWASVVLPATHLAVLYGVDGPQQLPILLALIGLNVCCLIIGHGYLN